MLKNIILCSFWLAQSPLIPDNQQFLQLQNQLESYGFTVKIEPPPLRSTYGLLQTKTKTIWIEPLVFELGIELPTLIHEATHAAQLCLGKGEITSLNLDFSPPNIARPFFMHYNHGLRRHLEAEAYAIQTHPDGLNLVLSLLSKHCQ
jgi:hypothetical protein